MKLGITKITTAINGSDAVAKMLACGRVIDIILCDLRMSSGNGLQLLKHVRTAQIKTVRPDTCFIFISAVTDTEAIQTALTLDTNGYLMKPFTIEKLQAAITKGRAKVPRLDMGRYHRVYVPDAIA